MDSVSLDRNVLEIFVRLYAEMFEVLDVCWARATHQRDGLWENIRRFTKSTAIVQADCAPSIIPILLKLLLVVVIVVQFKLLLFIRLFLLYY